jgi:hypothetical protein
MKSMVYKFMICSTPLFRATLYGYARLPKVTRPAVGGSGHGNGLEYFEPQK